MKNLTNYGERQNSEVLDWGYFAHLSIYEWAAQFAEGKRCLDVGCGTGYGENHLYERGGASVFAIDKDASVIEVLRDRYQNVKFCMGHLDGAGIPFPNNFFDLIFSSNVFEHLAYVDTVLVECCRVSKSNGITVIAVPPIITVEMLIENAKNIFHINNIPPWTWKKKLLRFFGSVEYFCHWVKPKCLGDDGVSKRDHASLDDFIFPPDQNYRPNTITSVLVCRNPLEVPLPKNHEESCPEDWRHLKAEAEARQMVFSKLQKAAEDTTRYWRNEISSLLTWIELSRRQRASSDVLIEAISKHLLNYLG